MLYVCRRPGKPLDAFVESIWLCQNDARWRALERVLPTGAAQLIVNLAEEETRTYESTPRGIACHTFSASILTGVTTRFQIIDTAEQQHVAGIVFRPAGTLAFVPSPASELTDANVALDNLWEREIAAQLREQLLAVGSPQAALNAIERWLLENFRSRACHPVVAFALAKFHRQPCVSSIRAVKESIGLSPKRFIERFKAEVGVTPKRYCRLLRFQRAVARAHKAAPVDWTQLALECGYFDQAHFIHEFGDFAGLTPSAYQQASTAFQNHVTFLQST